MNGEKGLGDLPSEILQQIFQPLDAVFLVRSVKLVCKRFYVLLSDEAFWRQKVLGSSHDGGCPQERRILVGLGVTGCADPGRFRPLSREPGWCDVCYREAVERALWSWPPLQRAVLNEPHYAPIDALCLFRDGACVTGGRDRIVAVWGPGGGGERPLAVDSRRHTGWVWDVAAPPHSRQRPDHFYSCAWDSTVIHWALREASLQPVCSRFIHPALCIGCSEGVVAVGLHVPKVALIDTRLAAEGACASFRAHSRPVIGLHLEDRLVVTISEDRSLWATDLRRMTSPVARLQVKGRPAEGSEGAPAHPRSLARNHSLYYVGDTRGGLHIIDSSSGEFRVDAFYPGVAQRSITGLAPTLSTLTVGSQDKTVRIFSMIETGPRLISEWTMDGEVCGLDYNGETLAVTTTENSVFLYGPGSEPPPSESVPATDLPEVVAGQGDCA